MPEPDRESETESVPSSGRSTPVAERFEAIDEPLGGWATGITALSVILALASAVVVSLANYRAIADWGAIATRSFDVGTAQTPLLGTRSSVAADASVIMHHPGPMQFFVLAPFVRIFGEAGLPIGAAVVHAMSIVALVLLCRRLMGEPAAFAAALCSLALVTTLGYVELASSWPPIVIIVPTAIAVVATIGCVGGDRVSWLALVVAGSFVAQSNLAALPLVVALGLISAIGFVATQWSQPRAAIRTVWPSLAIGLVLWLPSLVEQLTDDRPNLSAIVRHAGDGGKTFGYRRAAAFVGSTLSGPFGWAGSRFDRPWIGEVNLGVAQIGASPNWFVVVAGVVVTIAALGLMWRSADARTRIASIAAIGAALLTWLFASKLPFADGYISLGWTRWMWGAAVAVSTIVTTGLLLVRRFSVLPGVRATLIVLALVPAVFSWRDDRGELSRIRSEGKAVDLVNAQIADAVSGSGPVLLRYDFGGAALAPTVIRHLENQGRTVYTAALVDDQLAKRVELFGDERQAKLPSSMSVEDVDVLDLLWMGATAESAAVRPSDVIACGAIPLAEARELVRLRELGDRITPTEATARARLEARVQGSRGLAMFVVFHPAQT